ncbi:hypothetical protein [Rhizomonospora bruguierae]|uniref:hypothetical protein n=1 Tax=Rhizomonospora bruguierae TaxID=1581705 RepID=UPI001BCC8E8D|nr:hypothetical protein [Micromonospora sp. NBRC 107566]
MCGSVSAIGLEDRERELWPYLRERLRRPGHLMAIMRGVLGDVEVAAVVAVTPQGAVTTLALLTTAETIAQEIHLPPQDRDRPGVRRGRIGDYDVDVLVGAGPDGVTRPLAVLATPWIEQHLLLYARTLWHRRPARSTGPAAAQRPASSGTAISAPTTATPRNSQAT